MSTKSFVGKAKNEDVDSQRGKNNGYAGKDQRVNFTGIF